MPKLFWIEDVVAKIRRISYAAANPLGSALGLLLVLAGLPVCYFWARSARQKFD